MPASDQTNNKSDCDDFNRLKQARQAQLRNKLIQHIEFLRRNASEEDKKIISDLLTTKNE